MITFLIGGLVALFITAVICVAWQIFTAPVGKQTENGFEVVPTAAAATPLPSDVPATESYSEGRRGDLPARG